MLTTKTYLPERCTLAIDQRLFFPDNAVKLFILLSAEVGLHHEAQEGVVWGVSCLKSTENLDFRVCFSVILLVNSRFKTCRNEPMGRGLTKHGVELHLSHVQGPVWTGEFVFLGPSAVIEVRLSAKRVQNTCHAPDGHTVTALNTLLNAQVALNKNDGHDLLRSEISEIWCLRTHKGTDSHRLSQTPLCFCFE